MTEGRGGPNATGEPSLSPHAVAAYVHLALVAYFDVLREKELPVPRQVREVADLYRGWARVGAGEPLPIPPGRERPLLLTYAEVARLLGGIDPRTVRRLISKGELRGVRIGTSPRVHIDDLNGYLDRLRDVPVDHAGLGRTTGGAGAGRSHAGPDEHDEEAHGDEDGDADRAA